MAKITMLERYIVARQSFDKKHKEIMPTPGELWYYQELLYRIEVFEAFRLFRNAAPLSSDMKELTRHYRIVDAFVENLKNDRRYPGASKDEVKKQRETALASLSSVIADYRKRYASYKPQSPEQYHKDIGAIIATVLPAWVQYRNAIVEIKLEEGAS